MTATKPLDGAPAIRGGRPAFPDGLPLARPSVNNIDRVTEDLHRILKSGMLTNHVFVRELESRCSEYLGVTHCVAVSSATSGLMLVLKALELTGSVVVPSFTFAATVHSVAWNGLRPLFADIDAETLSLDAEATKAAITDDTAAILGVHVFGAPSDITSLEQVAKDAEIALVFDAAHGFGARHQGTRVGRFGRAEVFSLTPTKPLAGSEGGLVTTDDDELAERIRIGRDYGNPGDYDCLFIGLSSRLSEIHAAIALAHLEDIDDRLTRRNHLAAVYQETLGSHGGISFPRVREGDFSTFKDLTVLVDRESFGMSAVDLASALGEEGISTRRYYAPPVHRMKAYSHLPPSENLATTDDVADRVLTLPLLDGMGDEQVQLVCSAIRRIQGAL